MEHKPHPSRGSFGKAGLQLAIVFWAVCYLLKVFTRPYYLTPTPQLAVVAGLFLAALLCGCMGLRKERSAGERRLSALVLVLLLIPFSALLIWL